jgi:hypothetical protein
MTTLLLSDFPGIRRTLAAGVMALACVPALATTFTNDTTIGVSNTNYDGTAIVVTNCTVKVDGPHAFASVLVAAGGVLTHSFSPSGTISNLLFVSNESQVLRGNNAVTLLNSNVITATVSVTDSSGAIDYTSGVDYSLSSPNGILTELQRTANSRIPNGATVLVSYEALLGFVPAGLNLSVTGNVEVDFGGAIKADGNGYGGGLGAGAGHSAGSPQDGSGAGYGGLGGTSSSNAVGGATYGSFTQPANLGSGGGASYAGAGGAGGGMIEIVAGGNVIANGSISANGGNGTNSRSGGGSGGSVWLTALTLSGSGAITANGGGGDPTHGGGGGGGRIAIQCGTTTFAGSMAAYGGAGASIGGAGTVYTKLTGENGLLAVDNGGQSGTNTLLAVGDEAIDVLIEGNAGVMPSGAWSIGNLTIASNGLLLATPLNTITLTAAGDIAIEAGGGLLANAAGFAAGAGPGAGHGYNDGLYRPCGGGGNGGNGASSSPTNGTGGTAYGNAAPPSGLGSGGGTLQPDSIGGSGGGGILITSLTGIVLVDGTIAANGGNGSGSGGGGGSGGTIVLTGGTLLGSGSITANGGNGANSIGGGGGGGRIGISLTANLFGGTIATYGGGGGNWGGAGTLFILERGQTETAQLILDNNGHAGTNTPLQSTSSADLIVRGGAVGSASSSVSFANLYLSSNGWLFPAVNESSPAESLNFSIAGNAIVQAGGGIVADYVGYAGGEGPGEGHFGEFEASEVCSGGGHGGRGGNSFGNYATGGTTYDYAMEPNQPGSGGGGFSTSSPGGAGGGVIRLIVTGTLEVEGIVSANGGSGSGFGGGGSGGSIWLAVGMLSGAGSITADGGNGADTLGGGGGGGMIYISCNDNSFSGTLTAYGGGGANWGGAGPTVIQVSQHNAQFILDGGGHAGPATPLAPSSSTTDLTLRNGAVGLANTYTTLGNVLVSSNAWLLVTNLPSLTFLSATIQAGGGIIADATGYAAGQGPGAGHYSTGSLTSACSGAGHGGNGANSSDNSVVGGAAYDNPIQPALPGSGGGTESFYSAGGAGGGAFRLKVTGLLQNDGTLSANGASGGGIGSGGGSGGSIWLTVGTLSGTGLISANGGDGVGSVGGGGAGGCIAIYPTTNLFAGTITVYGGGGANWGGAGTIFIEPNGQTAQFILDNGGQSGATTPILAFSSGALILRNGAVGYQQEPAQTIASLLISSNAWLTADPISGNNHPGIVNLTVTGDATVAAGGGIVADHAGSAAGMGNGAGHSYNNSPDFPCSGAGYGGYGAVSAGDLAAGGLAYGSTTSPAANGSGGGAYSSNSIGGAGGGSIRLTVNGTLMAAGKISANGGNGSGLGGGGGSGGSIWLTAGTLAGAGSITANGGNGADAIGGGGGGGRISIGYTASDFAGLISAYGGGGYAHGGAGTIYMTVNGQSAGQLILDNGGAAGTNTPLSSTLGAPSQPLNLTIGNGAVVCPQPQASFPLLSNLTVASGGLLTGSSGQATLDLLVFNNVDVAPGGVIAVDGDGFAQAGGPGAGLSIEEMGSGAGYGGVGGASATAPGGASYGSSNQPVDFGSGGGFGSGGPVGGSSGGGALRLSVGGILTVDGQLSADGEPGLQDNSGGGSGGSLWVTAGTLAGSGLFSADGGAGELYGGGGGAGGRIALYSQANIYLGRATASGAGGESAGADGTIYSNNVPPLQVLSNSPAGIVSNGVSSVVLYFNEAPNPNSIAASAVSLTTPNGPLSSGSFSISMLSSASYLVSFPLQTAVGNYALTVGPDIVDLYGRPMSPAYTGAFTVVLPVIAGSITDTNGEPVAGVLLQPSAGLSSTTTDANGKYALAFVPGTSFTVTPLLGSLVFVPASLSYTNVFTSISNQNYVALSTLAPVLTAGGNATNFVVGWQALAGVKYQIYNSTNLADWQPYGSAITGSNGPVQIPVPTGGSAQFFSVQSSY